MNKLTPSAEIPSQFLTSPDLAQRDHLLPQLARVLALCYLALILGKENDLFIF